MLGGRWYSEVGGVTVLPIRMPSRLAKESGHKVIKLNIISGFRTFLGMDSNER